MSTEAKTTFDPKMSYRNYTSFLKQYSKSSPKPAQQSIIPEPKVEKSVPDSPKLENLTIEQLKQLTNKDFELIDMEKLEKFLEQLKLMNQNERDCNNNLTDNRKPVFVDIETTKQNLIESLKQQLKLTNQ